MHASPLTRGIGITAAILVTLSVVLADAAFLAAGGILLLFLLYRALAFDRAVATLLPALSLRRSLSSAVTRTGRLLQVTTVITAPPTLLSLRATDLPPSAALVAPGTNAAPLCSGETVLRYTVQLAARGLFSFEGLSLWLGDPFFSRTIDLKGEPFRLPEVRVYPQDAPASADLPCGCGEWRRKDSIGIKIG